MAKKRKTKAKTAAKKGAKKKGRKKNKRNCKDIRDTKNEISRALPVSVRSVVDAFFPNPALTLAASSL